MAGRYSLEKNVRLNVKYSKWVSSVARMYREVVFNYG